MDRRNLLFSVASLLHGKAFILNALYEQKPAEKQPHPVLYVSPNDDIQSTIDKLSKQGGGILKLSEPEYVVHRTLKVPDKVMLVGAGKRASRLIASDSLDGHMVRLIGDESGISQLSLHGNRLRTQKRKRGHNIRVEGDFVTVSDLTSINSPWYGIGIGQASSVKGIVVHNVEIVNSGSDGIDIKSRGGTSSVLLKNIIINGFARAPRAKRDAGIDVRGNTLIIGAIVNGIEQSNFGIRFRKGGIRSPNGIGGHGSSLVNATIIGSKNLNGRKNTTGIAVHSSNVKIDAVDAMGLSRAVVIGGNGTIISNSKFSARTIVDFLPADKRKDPRRLLAIFMQSVLTGKKLINNKKYGRLTAVNTSFNGKLL